MPHFVQAPLVRAGDPETPDCQYSSFVVRTHHDVICITAGALRQSHNPRHRQLVPWRGQ
jgi:hypothetical protein